MNPSIEIEDNALLSTNGLLGKTFIVLNPEPYSLSDNSIGKHMDDFTRALNLLGEGVIYHRIDVFRRNTIRGESFFFYEDFLNRVERNYFDGRESYGSYTLISFFLDGLESLEREYLANPFTVNENMLDDERQRIQDFERNINNAVNILKQLPQVEVTPIEEEELRYFIFNSINGFHDSEIVHNGNFSDQLKIGDQNIKIFSFSSTAHFPNTPRVIEADNTVPRSNFVSRGTFDELGIHFHFDHVCHQIIKIPKQDQAKEVLEIRKTSYKSWAGYKKSIQDGFDTLEKFEASIDSEDNKLCYVHNSIMLFDRDTERLEKATKRLGEIFSNKGLQPMDARYEFAHNIHTGSILGRENEISDDFFYMSSLKDSVPLMPIYGNFRNDKTGLVFQDRVFRAPLVVDVFDLKRRYIAARNGMIITSTGKGKSSTLLNISYQSLLFNVKLVFAEFGQSLSFLVKLFKDRAAHIKFKANEPMGINPFVLRKPLDPIKVISVTGFILKLWRKNMEMMQSEGPFFVALSKIVSNYYKNNLGNHDFESFYWYILNNWDKIKAEEKIKDKFLDLDEFELVMSQYIKDGLYDFIFQPNPSLHKSVDEADIVVFELTEVKKDPFLLSIILTSLEDTINNNILSDRSRFGGVIMEEFGETAELRDIFGGGDVLSSVAWLYQKIRKENGFIWTVLQNISQLPDNHYTDNIISNVQLLMTLSLTEKVVGDIVDKFEIKDQDHINMMKSCQENFETSPKWSELCIRWEEKRAMVVRQEFALEKFLAFQTDGDIWDWMNKDYQETNDMIKTIENTKKHYNYESIKYVDSPFLL